MSDEYVWCGECGNPIQGKPIVWAFASYRCSICYQAERAREAERDREERLEDEKRWEKQRREGDWRNYKTVSYQEPSPEYSPQYYANREKERLRIEEEAARRARIPPLTDAELREINKRVKEEEVRKQAQILFEKKQQEEQKEKDEDLASKHTYNSFAVLVVSLAIEILTIAYLPNESFVQMMLFMISGTIAGFSLGAWVSFLFGILEVKNGKITL
jgi:hypothetical protein